MFMHRTEWLPLIGEGLLLMRTWKGDTSDTGCHAQCPGEKQLPAQKCRALARPMEPLGPCGSKIPINSALGFAYVGRFMSLL